jgi:hypothetical protein
MGHLYFLQSRMSIGASFLWHDASNLTAEVQENPDVRNTDVAGKGVFLNWRYKF